jgi:hypothetical protein
MEQLNFGSLSTEPRVGDKLDDRILKVAVLKYVFFDYLARLPAAAFSTRRDQQDGCSVGWLGRVGQEVPVGALIGAGKGQQAGVTAGIDPGQPVVTPSTRPATWCHVG